MHKPLNNFYLVEAKRIERTLYSRYSYELAKPEDAPKVFYFDRLANFYGPLAERRDRYLKRDESAGEFGELTIDLAPLIEFAAATASVVSLSVFDYKEEKHVVTGDAA